MILPDVNVLIYAHRQDVPDHPLYAQWLTDTVTSAEPFALSELILSSVIRIVTNPRVFRGVTPLAEAFAFTEALLTRPNCVRLRPGPRHWSIYQSLCTQASATAKLTADGYHAALAIEHGCEFISTDSDFDRFPALRWRHPLRRG